MSREPSDFRERLLDAQPTSAALRDEYRRELDALLHHRLTPRGRALAWICLLASLALVLLCLRGLIWHHDKPQSLVLFPAYAAVFAAAALLLARVLWKGAFARKASFAAIEGLGGTLVGVFLVFTLLHGMRAPADPASTYWTVWGVLLLTVGFAWGTGNRIAAATLETREHLLRIESRLADLAEQVRR
jgi:hypothetical protein